MFVETGTAVPLKQSDNLSQTKLILLNSINCNLRHYGLEQNVTIPLEIQKRQSIMQVD